MTKAVEFSFAEGGSIAVEVADAGAGTSRGMGDDAAAQVTQTFDAALNGLHKVADGLQAALRRSLNPPDAVTVQFGVNFSAESGLIIAKGSVGATLDITMQWKSASGPRE